MTRNLTAATVAFALLGMFFASYATLDFANHLDRQVHNIHCSFLPGVQAAASDSEGCQVTLMSRYSSVLRTQVWGGIPVSLPGMALFAFLGFWGSYLLASKRHTERNAAYFTLLAWTVPLITSGVMGYLALVELDAACKLCIGIYTSSTLGFLTAIGLVWAAHKQPVAPDADPSFRREMLAIPVGLLFIALPIAGYVASMPDYSEFAGGCGELRNPQIPNDLLVSLGGSATGRPTIEVLDPLCPSCRGLEGRLEASGLDAQLSRKALLFPLDNACNWMVSSSLHPGACAISEAMLCEPSQANAILDWAFENQPAITAAERATEGSAARMVTEQFPDVRGCVGSARIGQRLNRGLRWAVSNQIPVLTPQLFVDGRKVCNEDTDLGLEYTLTRMLETPVVARGDAR
jgi:uncharacterized membrane protein